MNRFENVNANGVQKMSLNQMKMVHDQHEEAMSRQRLVVAEGDQVTVAETLNSPA